MRFHATVFFRSEAVLERLGRCYADRRQLDRNPRTWNGNYGEKSVRARNAAVGKQNAKTR